MKKIIYLLICVFASLQINAQNPEHCDVHLSKSVNSVFASCGDEEAIRDWEASLGGLESAIVSRCGHEFRIDEIVTELIDGCSTTDGYAQLTFTLTDVVTDFQSKGKGIIYLIDFTDPEFVNHQPQSLVINANDSNFYQKIGFWKNDRAGARAVDGCSEIVEEYMVLDVEQIARCQAVYDAIPIIAVDACGNADTIYTSLTITGCDGIQIIQDDLVLDCKEAKTQAGINQVKNWLQNFEVLGAQGTVVRSNDYDFTQQRPCGSIPVTFTATADNGSASVTANLIIIDSIAPYFVERLPDISVSCIDDLPATDLDQYVIDQCTPDIALVVTSNDVVTQDTVFRQYTVTDRCGNSSGYVQKITITGCDDLEIIQDDLVLDCKEAKTQAGINQVKNWLQNFEVLGAQGTVVRSNDYDFTQQRPCGSIPVTFTATADNGSASVTANLIIIDSIAPYFVERLPDTSVDCIDDLPATDLDQYVIDQCTPDIALVVTSNDVVTQDTVFRQYTVTDRCGNSSGYVQKITITGSCGGITIISSQDFMSECVDIEGLEAFLRGDLIEQTGAVSITNSLGDQSPEFLFNAGVFGTVIFTLTDAEGNVASVENTLDLYDYTSPTIEAISPTHDTIRCGQELNDIVYSAIDNCNELTIDTVETRTANAVTRMIIVTDRVGNADSVSYYTRIIEDLSVTTFSINPSCGESNGTIGIENVTGGVAPYKYFWSYTNNQGGAPAISGLRTGHYSVTITDAVGCTTMRGFVLRNEGNIRDIDFETSGTNCSTGLGGVDAFVDKASESTISYLWSNGHTGPSLSDVPAGTYSLTVRDQFGCSLTRSVTLEGSEPLDYSLETLTNPNSCINTLGEIDVLAVGGVAPYSYLWQDSLGIVVGETHDLKSMEAGQYTVLISDANGCTVSDQFRLTEPEELIATIMMIQPTTCHAESPSGRIMLDISGGQAPYETFTGDELFDLNGLDEGTYTFDVVDAVGCTVELRDIEVPCIPGCDVAWMSGNTFTGQPLQLWIGQYNQPLRVVILNAAGIVVQDNLVDTRNAGTMYDVDLTGLPNGMYVLAILNQGGEDVLGQNGHPIRLKIIKQQ